MIRKYANKALGHLPDALMVGGGGALSYGAWLVYQPAGFIVLGLLAISAGWLIARGGK